VVQAGGSIVHPPSLPVLELRPAPVPATV